jgi:hypothetical protein
MILAALWCNIEIAWGPSDQRNTSGEIVVVLFVAAITIVALGHFLVPATMRQKARELLSAFGVGDKGQGGADRVERESRLPSLGAEKRVHTRRSGNPVPIWLADSPDGASKSDAVVLDRSRGGLLIGASQRLPVGAIRYVRTHNAPEDLEWIQIEVRHCRQRDGRWLLGSKFSKELPWSLVLLFG